MDNNKKSEFYTLKKYRLNESDQITESMEDYIEMIYRISRDTGYTRVNDISKKINVSPSSTSKMMSKLKEAGIVTFPKYGIIKLTQEGLELGSYLMWRHNTIESFLCLLNGSDNEIKQAEQIEHYLNKTTVYNLEKLTHFMSVFKWFPNR